MRVTNRSTTRNYLKNMNKALSDQANIENRIASNNRFERISDDVSSGVQAMKTRSELFKSEKQLSNVQSISEDLNNAEAAMTNIGDLLANIHPKIQKAVNGTTSEGDRKILAEEIKTMREEILADLNAKSNSQYLFGGVNNYSPPFSIDKDSGKLMYNGVDVDQIQKRNDGSYYYKNDHGTEVDIPMEDDVYMDIGLGIRMTGSAVDPQSGFKVSYSGLDIAGFGTDENGLSNNFFNVLNEIEKALTSDSYQSATVDTLDKKLVSLTDKFRTNVTDVGSRAQFLDTMKGRLQANVDSMDAKISRLTGTDFGEESIHQATNVAVLNAIYKLGTNIVPLSLMDFIK